VIVRGWLFALLIAGTGVAAEAPGSSLRPVLRGAALQEEPGTPAPSADEVQGPRERGGLFQSLRPIFRSRKVEKEGRAARRLRQKGALCGNVAIQGEAIGQVKGELQGCGVENAVRVRSVSGVALSTGSVMDCGTAKALNTWMARSAKPALSRRGGGLHSVKVAAHYACRTRNNQRGARVSEHGKGRAIDISGFRLRDGTEVSVLKGWSARRYSKPMRQMHQGACGPFGTVLGPNANKFHRDHFHFDTARYRSGRYCK